MLTQLIQRWRNLTPMVHALPFVAALAVVSWLTLTPTPPPPPSHWFGFDKVAHFGCWAALAFLVFPLWAKRGTDAQAARLSFAAASAYGALIELGQLLVPGRSAEVLDFVADTLGAAVGVLVVRWLWHRSAEPESGETSS